MIVAFLNSPHARAAVGRAAYPDEDVIFGELAGLDAIHRGFPRLVVRDDTRNGTAASRSYGIPVLTIGQNGRSLARDSSVGSSVEDTKRLRVVLNDTARTTWVDGALASLARTSGGRLPPAFRGMARRILEYSARYPDLHAVAHLTGLSRGAIKARFRRRGLPSPSSHIRWLRTLATAHVLAQTACSVEEAAYQLGFTSGGNLCRAVHSATGLTPGDLRISTERTALHVRFTERFLGPKTRSGWADLADVFLRDFTAA